MGWQEDFQREGMKRTAAALSGQMPTSGTGVSGVLTNRRARFFDEMDRDPNFAGFVRSAVMHENGGHREGVLEAAMNRADMNGTTLRQQMNSGFFGPINRGAVHPIPANAGDIAAFNRVRAGSNDIQLLTDQGMAREHGPAAAIGIGPTKIRGEYYSPMGRAGLAWKAGIEREASTANAAPQDRTFPTPQEVYPGGVVATRPLPDAPNLAVAAASSIGQLNPNTGTVMHPTPGRDTIALNGLDPEQQRDALQASYDRGNKNMLYVHDENPRVIARPGDAKWSPTPPDSETGPTFANSFLASNSDYGKTGLPMRDDNALKGSRYDDGTATGMLSAPTQGDPVNSFTADQAPIKQPAGYNFASAGQGLLNSNANEPVDATVASGVPPPQKTVYASAPLMAADGRPSIAEASVKPDLQDTPDKPIDVASNDAPTATGGNSFTDDQHATDVAQDAQQDTEMAAADNAFTAPDKKKSNQMADLDLTGLFRPLMAPPKFVPFEDKAGKFT